jgi:hypothetical protein
VKAVRALSFGVALGAIALGTAGCAQGGAGDDDETVSSGDSGTDGTLGSVEGGGTNPGDDGAATGDDGAATSGDDDSGLLGDDDSGSSGDDGSVTSDDGGPPDDDSGGGIVDSGHDAGHDAGVDSGEDAGHDAGFDAGVDAGHDAGFDAGVDAGFDAGPCSPTDQTGCPGGEACSLGGTGAPVCVTPGPTAPGGSCGVSGTDNCAAGGLCAGDDPDGGGNLCHQFCTTNSDCSAAAVSSGSTSESKNHGYCVIDITNSTPDQMVCNVPCNPVTHAGASGCNNGQFCVYGGTTTVPEYTDCESVGPLLAGATCTGATLATSCDFGLTCVVTGGGTSGKCRYVCRAGTGTTDCQGTGDTCETFTGITSPMFGFCSP